MISSDVVNILQLQGQGVSHVSESGTVRREGRTILGGKLKLLYSEEALPWKPFAIGCMHIYAFYLE